MKRKFGLQAYFDQRRKNIDDNIGVTEAGNDAKDMNAFLNAKTAEKNLQYSSTKCESMLVWHLTDQPQSVLYVDKWYLHYYQDESGETCYIKTYSGPVSSTNILVT